MPLCETKNMEKIIMSMLENNSYPQEIETEILTVRNNIMEFKDYFIQISNISEAEIAPIPKLPYPVLAIVLLLMGILLFVFGISDDTLSVTIIGLIMVAISAVALYKTYQKNQNRGEVLILGLNSGKRFYFKCYNKSFLRTVLNTLKSCVNTKNQSVTFDLRESKITDAPIINGNNNDVLLEV